MEFIRHLFFILLTLLTLLNKISLCILFPIIQREHNFVNRSKKKADFIINNIFIASG